jgi:hypothetical protein
MKRIFVSLFAVAVLCGLSLAQEPTSTPSNNSTPQEEQTPATTPQTPGGTGAVYFSDPGLAISAAERPTGGTNSAGTSANSKINERYFTTDRVSESDRTRERDSSRTDQEHRCQEG